MDISTYHMKTESIGRQIISLFLLLYYTMRWNEWNDWSVRSRVLCCVQLTMISLRPLGKHITNVSPFYFVHYSFCYWYLTCIFFRNIIQDPHFSLVYYRDLTTEWNIIWQPKEALKYKNVIALPVVSLCNLFFWLELHPMSHFIKF